MIANLISKYTNTLFDSDQAEVLKTWKEIGIGKINVHQDGEYIRMGVLILQPVSRLTDINNMFKVIPAIKSFNKDSYRELFSLMSGY